MRVTRREYLRGLPLALLLFLLCSCGGPQEVRGPADVAWLGEAAATVLEGARVSQERAVHSASRVDGLVSHLPADPLVLFGLDVRAGLSGLADGSLLHGLASSDERLRDTLFRMIEVVTAAVTRHTTDTEWQLDFRALESLVVGSWLDSEGRPYVIVALQEAFFVNAEETIAVMVSSEPDLVVHRRDGIVFFTDEPLAPLLEPDAPRLDPEVLLADAIPQDALWFVVLPDVSRLPTTARFLLYNRIGGRIDRLAHHVTAEGEVSFRLEGGGGEMVHHQLQLHRAHVLGQLSELPVELSGAREYIRLVSDVLFSRLEVTDLEDGGVVVRIAPPVCGGLFQNHGPLAVLMSALADEHTMPEEPLRFEVPAGLPVAEGCLTGAAPPALRRLLLPYFDSTPGPGQEFWASGDLFRWNVRLASSGFGLLPVRIDEAVVEGHMHALLGTSPGEDAVVEVVLRFPPSESYDEAVGLDLHLGLPEDAGMILSLPQALVDQLPVFMLVMFGIDLMEHPELGTLVVYGLGGRLGSEEVLAPRAVELIGRFGSEGTFLLLAGAADPEGEPEELEGFLEELDLPEQRLSFSMRYSDGVWLQITDWADGHGARGEEVARQPGQLAGTVLDLLVETFDPNLRSPELFEGEVRDALIDWTNALYGGENLVRLGDTTVNAFSERRMANSLLTSLGMVMSALILYAGVTGKDDETGLDPPGEVVPPGRHDGPFPDAF